MRRILWAGLALLFLCGGSGCMLNKRVLLTKQLIAVLNEFSDVLSLIRDKETAEDAKPKLKALGDRVKEIAEEAGKLEQPRKEELEEMVETFEDYKDDIQYTRNRLN